jgi:hypothetical protein
VLKVIFPHVQAAHVAACPDTLRKRDMAASAAVGHQSTNEFDHAMKKELPIPEAALEDKDAVEMLRVWIAQKRLHCSLKIGLYQESTRIPEAKAWGTILADAVQHIADALQTEYGKDRADTLSSVREAFLEELDAPTSKTEGGFVQRH